MAIDRARRLVPSARDDHPIHRAAEAGDLRAVAAPRGATYDLTIAAALGDIEQIEAMLDATPTRISEDRPDARRPLTAAAEFGRTEIVRLLLERGVDPTWPDVDDSSRGAALHAAAGVGNLPMVQHGADPNGFVNAGGNSVYAAQTKEIRQLLIEHGGYLDPYDVVFLGEEGEVMRIITARPETANAGCGGLYPASSRSGNAG